MGGDDPRLRGRGGSAIRQCRPPRRRSDRRSEPLAPSHGGPRFRGDSNTRTASPAFPAEECVLLVGPLGRSLLSGGGPRFRVRSLWDGPLGCNPDRGSRRLDVVVVVDPGLIQHPIPVAALSGWAPALVSLATGALVHQCRGGRHLLGRRFPGRAGADRRSATQPPGHPRLESSSSTRCSSLWLSLDY